MARTFGFVVLIAACLLVSVFADDDEEKYDDKYDSLDVDALLANDRLRKQYLNCFLETSPCITPDAIFIKGKFPEAIVTKCRKCTEKQKEAFSKVAEWFVENDPEGWTKVMTKAVRDYQMKGRARTTPRARRDITY